MSSAPFIAGWRYRALTLSMLAAAAGYLGISLWAGWNEVNLSLGRVGLAGMAIAMSLSLVNYALRFARWQSYLSVMGNAVPWHASGCIYLAGFALTTTPGKAGEALRSVLLKRWDVSYPQSLAAFLSERLSDLVAILILALAGLSPNPWAKGLLWVGIAAVIAVLFLLSNKRWLQFLHRQTSGAVKRSIRLIHHGFHILLEARRCHAPGALIVATFLSLVAWSAEAFAFYLLLCQLGSDPSLSFAIFVYSASTLAGALSFLPGGLGGTEAAMVALLVTSGMPEPEAVAATVLIRAATLWFAVVLGVIALASSRPTNVSA